jgi:uncharacterized repeat protein (TIGR03803 family)
MRAKMRLGYLLTLSIFTFILFGTAHAGAQEKILHNFGGKPNEGSPSLSLIFDGSGNLYGTTSGGGTVFELSPAAKGGWFERTLFTFSTTTTGSAYVGPLMLDGFGNLYGTTSQFASTLGGTVFELKHWPDGGWSQKILHNFEGTPDGSYPLGPLISDAAGNLFGTSAYGGLYSGTKAAGTVFELSPNADGTWTETVIHSFGNGTDGNAPGAGLIRDASGNLYGTTAYGGSHNLGTVFELSPTGEGWIETVIYNFGTLGNGTGGSQPLGGLIFDSAGNLYGTLNVGGKYHAGTAFKLSPVGDGSWTETALHAFGAGTDGKYPSGSLVFDTAGNLYGTTVEGGSFGTGGHGGIVFKLSPAAGGAWTETVLHSFGNGKDGDLLGGTLIFDSSGNLYGTTGYGGTYGNGVAFEITP